MFCYLAVKQFDFLRFLHAFLFSGLGILVFCNFLDGVRMSKGDPELVNGPSIHFHLVGLVYEFYLALLAELDVAKPDRNYQKLTFIGRRIRRFIADSVSIRPWALHSQLFREIVVILNAVDIYHDPQDDPLKVVSAWHRIESLDIFDFDQAQRYTRTLFRKHRIYTLSRIPIRFF